MTVLALRYRGGGLQVEPSEDGQASSSASPLESVSPSATSGVSSASPSSSWSASVSVSPSGSQPVQSVWTQDDVSTVVWGVVFMVGLLAMLAVSSLGKR